MADAPEPRRSRLPVLVVVVILLGVGVLWLLFRDTDSDATVAGMRWAHTTQLQRWQDVSRSDWHDNLVFRAAVPPVRGAGEVAAVLVTQCTSKLHHEETYDCGVETTTRREAYDCGEERRCKHVRKRVGNAVELVEECRDTPRRCHRDVTEEHPKTCKRPVHADWCEYMTQEWVPVRSEKIEGDAHLGMRFPDLPPGDDFERTEQSASYSLTFDYDGGQHTAVVPRSEYDQWNLGDPVVLRTEAVGGVLSFARPTGARR